MAAPSPRSASNKAKAGRAPAKKAAPLRAEPISDKPIGRFAELLTEIDEPEPYEVVEGVTIYPPTKSRMGLVVSAQTAYVIARGQLESMMSPILGEDGKPLLDEVTGQPIMPSVNREQMEQLETVTAKAAEDYDRALFGDAYDDVMRLSQNWTGTVWNAFYQDVQDRFLPVPQDGLCPTCGNVVDQEEAGKLPASETSSSTTGTPSKATSQVS